MKLSNFGFSRILSGAYKTLNLANQIIPLYKEISPMVKNARNAFSLISNSNLFKKDSILKKSVSINNEKIVQKKELSLNNPVFFN